MATVSVRHNPSDSDYRAHGYITEKPTPGRYRILYDLKTDPGDTSEEEILDWYLRPRDI